MKCPFRIDSDKTDFIHAHTSHIREHFADCMGKECAAFCGGACLRLQPPAYTMRANLTDKELQTLKNELMQGGQLMPYNPEQESVEVVPHIYDGETIFVDWHERLSKLEYIYNPGDDGPWYRADDVWACIYPARHKEVQK